MENMEKNWLKTFRILSIEMDSSETTILNLIDPEQFDAPQEPVKVGKRNRFTKEKLAIIKNALLEVAEYMQCTPLQTAAFIAVFSLQVGDGDNNIGISDLQRFFSIRGVNTFPIIRSIKELQEKHYMGKKRICGSEFFYIYDEVIRCILDNKPQISLGNQMQLDRYDFCSKVSDMIEDRDLTDILFEDVQTLEDENPQVSMIKKLIDNKIGIEDRTLFYEICDDTMKASAQRYGNTNVESTLNDIYDRSSCRMKVARELMTDRNALQKAGLIEKVGADFLADSELVLTDKGRELFMEDDVKLFFKKQSSKKLLDYKKIPQKQLYFEGELNSQISFFENSLLETNFRNLQKRLEQKSLPRGVAAIFYGTPGTGKTETVMQIARRTGRKVYHVDIAASKSCWFGESEKIIKRIFTDYAEMCKVEKKAPILLFNEADALFGKRKDSDASNVAQTENAIQNIILEGLEKLDGILIATTNLVDNLDAAFERRFLFKIKFERPAPQAQIAIWRDRLPGLTDDDYRILAEKYQFSGGEIENIVRKMTMNEIVGGSKLSLESVLELCKNEKLSHHSYTRIGF
ncbi:MAG: ATP-binding protein [Bacteroidales bacterium]|nr:ATP-binding protein [Bacteroidales bacterium]